jgi:hypothetical protein
VVRRLETVLRVTASGGFGAIGANGIRGNTGVTRFEKKIGWVRKSTVIKATVKKEFYGEEKSTAGSQRY